MAAWCDNRFDREVGKLMPMILEVVEDQDSRTTHRLAEGQTDVVTPETKS